jgi:hypothetical protein
VHTTHTKIASVVPPEDGRLTPETRRVLRHNKVIVKVKVYEVGYVIVIHNGTRSIKYQIQGYFEVCLFFKINVIMYLKTIEEII